MLLIKSLLHSFAVRRKASDKCSTFAAENNKCVRETHAFAFDYIVGRLVAEDVLLGEADDLTPVLE